MGEKSAASRERGHPEIFWVLFVVVSTGVFVAVVEPARREAEEVCRRVEAADAEIEARRARLEAKRRERQALEKRDPEAWRAMGHRVGLLPSGSRPAAPRSPEQR
jgi:hypothetical protein